MKLPIGLDMSSEGNFMLSESRTTPLSEGTGETISSINPENGGSWVVETQTSRYLIDLDQNYLLREPGGGDAGSMEPVNLYFIAQLRRDGTQVPLLELSQCRVGSPLLVLLDIRGDGVETLRRSTPVASITRICD